MTETIPTAQSKRIDALRHDHKWTPSEKLVGWEILNRLGSSANDTAKIFIREIATAVGVSERRTQTAGARLAELGYLIVRRRYGKANLYSLPKAPETTAPAAARAEVPSATDPHATWSPLP